VVRDRLVNPGCICPVCYEKHGDRRRLAIDHAAIITFRSDTPSFLSMPYGIKIPYTAYYRSVSDP
jgi:hypothetical protein